MGRRHARANILTHEAAPISLEPLDFFVLDRISGLRFASLVHVEIVGSA